MAHTIFYKVSISWYISNKHQRSKLIHQTSDIETDSPGVSPQGQLASWHDRNLLPDSDYLDSLGVPKSLSWGWQDNMLPVHNEAIVLPITASNIQPLHMGRFSSYLCHIFFHLQILLGTGCFDPHIWHFCLSASPPWGINKLRDHLIS